MDFNVAYSNKSCLYKVCKFLLQQGWKYYSSKQNRMTFLGLNVRDITNKINSCQKRDFKIIYCSLKIMSLQWNWSPWKHIQQNFELVFLKETSNYFNDDIWFQSLFFWNWKYSEHRFCQKGCRHLKLNQNFLALK